MLEEVKNEMYSAALKVLAFDPYKMYSRSLSIYFGSLEDLTSRLFATGYQTFGSGGYHASVSILSKQNCEITWTKVSTYRDSFIEKEYLSPEVKVGDDENWGLVLYQIEKDSIDNGPYYYRVFQNGIFVFGSPKFIRKMKWMIRKEFIKEESERSVKKMEEHLEQSINIALGKAQERAYIRIVRSYNRNRPRIKIEELKRNGKWRNFRISAWNGKYPSLIVGIKVGVVFGIHFQKIISWKLREEVLSLFREYFEEFYPFFFTLFSGARNHEQFQCPFSNSFFPSQDAISI